VGSGAVGGDTSSILVLISGNTFDLPTDAAFGDMFFGTLQGGTIDISGYAGADNNQGLIETFVQNNNVGTPTVNVFNSGGDISGTALVPAAP
jgi:hypothetical protein